MLVCESTGVCGKGLSVDYHYIVVGGGTAGCVVAGRLSEDPDTRVLLLEAGPAEGPAAMAVPPAWLGLIGSEVDWAYTTVPQQHTDDRTHPLPRGKVLGGSSSINGMTFVRGDRAGYDAWAESGATRWSYDDLLPYFKRSESTRGGDPEFRGTDGPLLLAPVPNPNPLARAMFDAVADAGYPSSEDPSGADPEGAGWYDTNIVDGKRQSAADAYLRPHLDRANLTVLTDALAVRLIMDGTRCTGVEYEAGGRRERAGAVAEVVLTAGTIGSAQLLLLSGIGPTAHLREHGIDTVIDLPGVGENLQDHLQVPLVYAASRPLPATAMDSNHGEMLALLRSAQNLPHPDMMVYPIDVPFAFGVPELPENGYTIMTTISRPHSRGTLRLAGADPTQPPLLDPGYLADERDMDTFLAGVRVARSLGESAAFADWRAAEVIPGPDTQTDEQWRAHIRRTVLNQFHPVGTCRMGTDPLAVVDPGLRVRGAQGLWVADASVMPSEPSVNIVAAVYAVAERAADLIKNSAAN